MAESVRFLIDLLLVFLNWVKGLVLFLTPAKYLAKDIRGEIVLITGGGSGIGQAVAVKLAQLGARIVIWDLSQLGMQRTRDMIQEFGGEIDCYVCDVAQRREVYKTAEKVKRDVGIVSILINNAGIVMGKKFLELEDEKIEKVFNVNTMAHLWTVKAFLPDMIKSDNGHLVFMSSFCGLYGLSKCADYCSSKYAIVGFEEALRYEIRSMGLNGVKTTVICPYAVNTGLFTGCKSPYMPIMEIPYVSENIVSSILKEQVFVIIPWYLNITIMLKNLLPIPAQHAVYDLFRGNDVMQDFVGRKPDKSEEEGLLSNGIRERAKVSFDERTT